MVKMDGKEALSDEQKKLQQEGLKVFSQELSRHTPLIKNLFITSKKHEKKMFEREIFLAVIIFLIIGILTYFERLTGETLASLIGIIIGYLMGRERI